MPPRYQSRPTDLLTRVRNEMDALGRPGMAGTSRLGGNRGRGGGRGQSALSDGTQVNDETASGSAHLLVMSVTDTSIASDGDHVAFDTIVSQHGFDGVVSPSDGQWVHPVSGVYLLTYEHEWDSYTDGGVIRLERNGVLTASGILLSGPSGQQGIGVIAYTAEAGDVGRIYVAQTSGSGQTCNATVRIAITDPTTVESEVSGETGGYRVSVSSDQDAIYLHRKLAGGSEVVLGSVAFSTSPNVWYGLRARIDGGRVRARAWAWADAEPSTWALDITDPDPLDAGYAGIATKGPFPNGQGGNQDVDSFTCSIEGGADQASDFTGDTAGTAPPTGWVVLVEKGSADWTVTDVSGDIMLRYDGSSSSSGQWIGWQTAGSGETMEVVAKVRHSASHLSSGIVLRGVVE